MNYLWIICKVVIVYFLLIFLLRILGKREVGQLSIFDLVVILILADIASIGIDNNDFFIPGVLCLFVLAILQKVLSLLLLKFSKLRDFCDGKPTVIVVNGKMCYKNMKKELYNVDDLVTQMHERFITDISEIKLAVLETSGKLSIIKKENDEVLCLPIIISGRFEEENLKLLNVEKIIIINKLKDKNLDVTKIIYASLNSSEVIYYYKDNKKQELIKPNKLKLSE